MEAIPLDNISADTVARAFYSNWIARFGTPHKLITDRGTQFRSETLHTLSKICGIKLQHTTAYHPACNGKVERLHRTLKTALKAHNNLSWIDTLPTVLLGLRTAIQEDNNHSIAQIVYGESLRLPGEFFSEPSIRTASEGFANNLQKQKETVGPRTTRRNSSRHIFVHKDLENCSHVFQRIDRVKKQLEYPYEGPFPVIERQDKYFTINIKGKNVNVSLDRLKPAYILAEDNSKATTTDHIKLQTSDNKPDLTQKQSRTDPSLLFELPPFSLSRIASLVPASIATPEKAGLHSKSVSSLYYWCIQKTPTASLEVVTGLQPLHLQIQQEATYARVARARSSSNFFTVIFSPTDYERKGSGIHIHPPNFLLHNQSSLAENRSDSGAKAIYTDGSETDESTGSAYCIL
ncbi:hypothetical protein AVEN_43268-1 [Araneus ventricosus]|uniref:Integrase catalytic domain-containing protein n=1 Tax=Araneus ventricosus TaxID=182803 RepID=A0A4Y2GEM6_ARAVE|nr:hypothetical protein AVEN_43268-1 [Araneus ventricosus]